MTRLILKRALPVLLLLLLLAALACPVFAEEEDEEELPQPVVHALYVNGRSDGSFGPRSNLSRAELAQMIYNLGDYAEAAGQFSDVSDDSWYARPVNALAAAGILNGYGDGTFRPRARMTRAALVTVLQRISGLTASGDAEFTDVDSSHWACGAIALAQEMKWVIGYSDGSFRPNQGVTRAEVVTILNRFLGRIPDREAIDAAPELRFFPDVRPGSWYYYDVMEAANTHTITVSEDGTAAIEFALPAPAPLEDGFYVIGGNLYAAENGFFVHEQTSGTLCGFAYRCDDESGVCTADALVLPLHDGTLVFLKNGRPEIVPGNYADGFYLRGGNLYAAKYGNLIRTAGKGTVNGIRYNCAGSTGICTVSASVLPLADGELAFLKDGRPEIEPGAFPDGFYLRDGNIYAAYRGYLLHVEKLCRLSGIYFDCAGASGVCKVRADALTLADGELILLRDGLALYAPGSYPNGFYLSGKNLYVAYKGYLFHSEHTGTLSGIPFTCLGKSGVCTAKTQILRLYDGELILLRNGKPDNLPGSYPDGFQVRNGLLYVVQNGRVLRVKTTGTCAGHSFTCTGSSGVCTADWTDLPLSGISLSPFARAAEAKPTCSFSDVSTDRPDYDAIALQCSLGSMSGSGSAFSPDAKLTWAQAIHAAVAIYETYFQVDRPEGEITQSYDLQQAKRYGILTREVSDSSAAITRADVAVLLVRALRGRELQAINSVPYVPALSESDASYSSFLTLYRAGVLRGVNSKEEAGATKTMTRADFAMTLTRLVLPGQRLTFTVKLVKTLQYGTSGSGKYPLTAYQIGAGSNVMVLTFAVHGWEDVWVRDGKALVYLADQTKNYLDQHYDLIASGDWTVYILRCVNPDGVYDGTTNNGPGRCTTTYYNANGVLVSGDGKGIDINRCFPYKYTVRTDARNFNGTAPLQCAEARALASFVQDVKGSGKNICIDTHGWLSQIIPSAGKGTIYKAFLKQFPNNSYANLQNGSGYFSAWAYSIGYDGCLFELPWGVSSYDGFVSSGYVEKFEAVIADLLKNYRDSGAARGPLPPDEFELDGN